jgi:hypothetical protein
MFYTFGVDGSKISGAFTSRRQQFETVTEKKQLRNFIS